MLDPKLPLFTLYPRHSWKPAGAFLKKAIHLSSPGLSLAMEMRGVPQEEGEGRQIGGEGLRPCVMAFRASLLFYEDCLPIWGKRIAGDRKEG